MATTSRLAVAFIELHAKSAFSQRNRDDLSRQFNHVVATTGTSFLLHYGNHYLPRDGGNVNTYWLSCAIFSSVMNGK